MNSNVLSDNTLEIITDVYSLEISNDNSSIVLQLTSTQLDILESTEQGIAGVKGDKGDKGDMPDIDTDLVVYFENKLL